MVWCCRQARQDHVVVTLGFLFLFFSFRGEVVGRMAREEGGGGIGVCTLLFLFFCLLVSHFLISC